MIISKIYNYQSIRTVEDFVDLFKTNIEQASWTENVKGYIADDLSFEVSFRFRERMLFNTLYCAKGTVNKTSNKTTVELAVGQRNVFTFFQIGLNLFILISSLADISSWQEILRVLIGVIIIVLIQALITILVVERLRDKISKTLFLKRL